MKNLAMLGCGDEARSRARRKRAGCEPPCWDGDVIVHTFCQRIWHPGPFPASTGRSAVVLATSPRDGPRPGGESARRRRASDDAIDADSRSTGVTSTQATYSLLLRRPLPPPLRHGRPVVKMPRHRRREVLRRDRSQRRITPGPPLLCAKGPFATRFGASFPKVRSQPVMGAHAAQARCKAHNTSVDGVDRSTGISSSIVVASVVCDARNPRNTTPAFAPRARRRRNRGRGSPTVVCPSWRPPGTRR